MKKKLLLGMAVLLSMAVLPSYGQTDDEYLTMFEWDFANGLGDFKAQFYWEDMDNWEAQPPSENPWVYDEENGWMESRQLDEKYRSWYLIAPMINLTERNYYDVKMILEYAIKGQQVEELYGEDGYSIGVDFNPKKNYSNYLVNQPIPDMVCNPNQIIFQEAEFSLARFMGDNVKITFRQQQQSTECKWYIRKFKIVGKHRFGGAKATKVSSIAEMKALPENTFVSLYNENGVDLLPRIDYNILARDETGAMLVSDGDPGYNDVILLDTLYGIYTREHGVPEIKNVQYYGSYDYDYLRSMPIEITDAEYSSHECDYVKIHPQGDVYVSSSIDELPDDAIWYTPHNESTEIKGFVFPTEERGMRFVTYHTNPYWFSITLSEDGNDVFTEQDYQIGMPFKLNRSMQVNEWRTFIFPGTSSDYSIRQLELAEFVSVENGIIQFQTTTSEIEPGKPYLVKPKSGFRSCTGRIAVTNSNPVVINGGEYNFVGTYNPIQPADGSYYLTEGNTIKPLSSGGTIKGFRAYFEPASPNAAKARAISIDGMTTAIEDIVGGEELLGLPQKIYTVGGQYVGDDLNALPKGVYLVNGKKIIK